MPDFGEAFHRPVALFADLAAEMHADDVAALFLGHINHFRIQMHHVGFLGGTVAFFNCQLEEQLHEKKVEAHFTDAIKEMLAAKGFDPLMGARPMSRLIQDSIRAALADELLFGRLANGGKVTVDVDADGQVRLDFVEEASEAAAV